MQMNKEEIIARLNSSMEELQQGIDTHCCLVASLLGDKVDEKNFMLQLERCPKQARELKLERALQEAIDVLEESRKSFKSKKLGELRRKLTHVLVESA